MMKFICSRENLLHGVNIVSKAVPSRTTMSILECILVETVGSEIRLTANDMEMGIETRIEGQVMEEGKIALDAKIFSDIVRKLPDNEVTIDADSNFVTRITCEKSKFNIIGKSGEDFSKLPSVERNKCVTISQFALKEVIRQTIFSISDDDSNKMMTGELFEIQGSRLKVVSLDGHRISIRNIELKEQYEDLKVIIPGKTLNEMSKILTGGHDEDVNIFFTDKHVIFEFDQSMVVSRLIEGEYFKVDQMLVASYETNLRINKREFLNCIDRSMLLVKDSDKKPIIINITDNNMELKLNSVIGSMNEEIDIEKSGSDILIGFNPKFLMDALRVIDDEEIEIYMVNPKAPCFIKDQEEQYIYLILPVNFNIVSD